ncbi:Cof protein [Klebsiella variicola]|uniref:Cof protein n=1 Tax=Klebsiella variicola TaxID=244366 RepID=A0A7H4MAZ6_KLEVA|nr:Cof protein [Klebsiella variicola]
MSRGELDPQGISKVFFTCEDHEHLLPLEQAMNARWGDRVNVSFSTLTCLEVMAGGVSKGHALEAVGENARLHSCRLHRLRRRYERR